MTWHALFSGGESKHNHLAVSNPFKIPCYQCWIDKKLSFYLLHQFLGNLVKLQNSSYEPRSSQGMLLQVEVKRIEERHVLRTVDDPKDAEEDGKPGGDTLAEEIQYGKCGFKGEDHYGEDISDRTKWKIQNHSRDQILS